MNNNNIAVGLDIGTTKIVAIVGQRNEHGKLEILGMGRAKSLGVHRGVVNNITQTIDSIKKAVAEAEKAANYKITDVTVGIAGQHIRSLQHSDYISRPNFDDVIDDTDLERLKEQVHKLVMLPGEEIIHVLPQEYKVDSQTEIIEPRGFHGSRLEANFHVVVGQISLIRNIARCVKEAGLNLVGITLEPLASSDAVLSQEEKEAGVALIDVGGGTTDIAIFKDNIIRHTAVIPFGGNVITDDIKTGCSIIERQAEILKVKYGSAWPSENKEIEVISIPGLHGREPKEITVKKLSQIIHARIEEIISLSYIELRNYGNEEQKKKLIAGIVMTGGGSKLKHLRQLTEYTTGMDVRIGYCNEHLASGQPEELASPEYATAIGLLMTGLDNLEIQKEKQQKVQPSIQPAQNVVSAKEENSGNVSAETIIEKKKEEKTPEKEKKVREKKKSIFSTFQEKFIKYINDTE
ncbi:cell division protein FtsA [Apibacter raozihei]|uniref:cell division protein FtsA n=1 Tax=Apibacter raozihei TaxID=2500547 RepID=UPI000FE2D2F3|nr:cell division protein FtsA [Apibacter raozihei]